MCVAFIKECNGLERPAIFGFFFRHLIISVVSSYEYTVC